MTQLEIAKRCQLLTGSFEGRKDGCGCLSQRDCKLSGIERKACATHPEVIAKEKECMLAWEELNP